MLKNIVVVVSLFSCIACNKNNNLAQTIADCQCQKFDTLAKEMTQNQDKAKDKAMDYMAQLLDCAAPHIETYKTMTENARHQLQIDIDKAVEAKCAQSKKILKQ